MPPASHRSLLFPFFPVHGPALATGWKTSLALTPTEDPTGERGPPLPEWIATAGHLLWQQEAAHRNVVTVGGGDKVSTAEDGGDEAAPSRGGNEEATSGRASAL
ncbi:hypothetical protein OsJ_06522 [Oryza sativa Japonica Group]|uniref:Uncharacterized protein n=1 Tax=Oryza sativa subsp. japonica TaxID=39947 RepID=A3A6A4_ORYSJ|nr:hypothetical protein OsJ_06522 [Oryza sativa Japonica Group]